MSRGTIATLCLTWAFAFGIGFVALWNFATILLIVWTILVLIP